MLLKPIFSCYYPLMLQDTQRSLNDERHSLLANSYPIPPWRVYGPKHVI